LEAKSSGAEQALARVNLAYSEFTSFYGSLLERGIDETEYGKTFSELSETLKEVYTNSKSNYDALSLNKSQFEAGRLERDAYERSIIRIEQFIIGAEFDIGLKVLPRLRRAEKELLQKDIVQKVETIDISAETKKEVKEEAAGILTSMAKIEKQANIDQVRECVGNGKKIMSLGQKVWKVVEKAAPAALPFILKLFSTA
jgi:hypothetical protein